MDAVDLIRIYITLLKIPHNTQLRSDVNTQYALSIVLGEICEKTGSDPQHVQDYFEYVAANLNS